MKKTLQLLVEKPEQDSKDCIVYNAHWRTRGDLIYFYIQANRYLRGMVRAITGTLLKAQELNYSESFIAEIFQSQNRGEAYDSVPANGLFLYKVEY